MSLTSSKSPRPNGSTRPGCRRSRSRMVSHSAKTPSAICSIASRGRRKFAPDIEAKPLYAMIDRKRAATSPSRSSRASSPPRSTPAIAGRLRVAALLGDDRIVPILNQQIRQWAESSRGKMAEYAVEALALLGTDAALLTVDALAIRYRAKNKNVGKAAVEAFAAAAENLGITPDELGDRVVPWLGFEPGQKRIIDCGAKKVEARIGSDLKLQFIDLEKNKPVASTPENGPQGGSRRVQGAGGNLARGGQGPDTPARKPHGPPTALASRPLDRALHDASRFIAHGHATDLGRL